MQSLLKQVQGSTQLTIRRSICESYYLQKVEEIELLRNYLQQAERSLGKNTICDFYKEVFYRWRRDARWLHRFVRKLPVL